MIKGITGRGSGALVLNETVYCGESTIFLALQTYVRPWLVGKGTGDLSVGPSRRVVSKETVIRRLAVISEEFQKPCLPKVGQS